MGLDFQCIPSLTTALAGYGPRFLLSLFSTTSTKIVPSYWRDLGNCNFSHIIIVFYFLNLTITSSLPIFQRTIKIVIKLYCAFIICNFKNQGRTLRKKTENARIFQGSIIFTILANCSWNRATYNLLLSTFTRFSNQRLMIHLKFILSKS